MWKRFLFSIGWITPILLASQTVPPSISTQPRGHSPSIGATVILREIAAGTPPLSYQWRRGESSIENAQTNSLSISNIQPAMAGNYSVIVSNSAGSITSAVATVVVDTTFTKIIQGLIAT